MTNRLKRLLGIIVPHLAFAGALVAAASAGAAAAAASSALALRWRLRALSASAAAPPPSARNGIIGMPGSSASTSMTPADMPSACG